MGTDDHFTFFKFVCLNSFQNEMLVKTNKNKEGYIAGRIYKNSSYAYLLQQHSYEYRNLDK